MKNRKLKIPMDEIPVDQIHMGEIRMMRCTTQIFPQTILENTSASTKRKTEFMRIVEIHNHSLRSLLHDWFTIDGLAWGRVALFNHG